jgi:hypothetical protein
MAEEGTHNFGEARIISDATKLCSEIKCICCQRLQQELEVALQALKSAKEMALYIYAFY